jgi:hypothetical protein
MARSGGDDEGSNEGNAHHNSPADSLNMIIGDQAPGSMLHRNAGAAA